MEAILAVAAAQAQRRSPIGVIHTQDPIEDFKIVRP
jgi:hypothetical protein